MRHFIKHNLQGLCPEPPLSSMPKMQALANTLGALKAHQLASKQKEDQQCEAAKKPKAVKKFFILLSFK